MKIHVLANDGSPLGVTCASIFGDDGRIGVGGAELSILTLMEGWHRRGDEVIFYNNPYIPNGSPFEQRRIADFDPHETRDVLVVFRSPNVRADGAKGLKVWLSCDQRTVEDFRKFSKTVHKIVTISKHHSHYFETQYGIEDSIPIDLPVRLQDYKEHIEKVPFRCIFTSIPDRGLMELLPVWKKIVERIPDASLVITSDWRLWTNLASTEATRVYRHAYERLPNVVYLGAVNRRRMIREQMAAQLHLYPCIYDELFCVAVAESQVAGAYPITSNCGALSTTNMGMVIAGDAKSPQWAEICATQAVDALTNPKLSDNQQRLSALAKKRFSIDRVLEQWDEKVFGGNAEGRNG